MTRKAYASFALLIVGVIALAIFSIVYPSGSSQLNWQFAAAALTALLILAFFFQFESPSFGSKHVAIIALLATLSSALRIPFAPLPNFQPCTFLIICSGYVFGPVPGFMIGAMTAVVSNFFLGQGPWTVYQMLAWGIIGCASSFLSSLNPGRGPLAVFGILCGFLFGFLTNIYLWLYFSHPLTLRTLLVVETASFWFDLSHASANAIFLYLFGPRLVTILERYRKRFGWVRSSGMSSRPAS